jgi:hypothetical protein
MGGVMDMRAVAELLDALPDLSAEVELRRQLVRGIGRDAYQRGYHAGYERAERDMARRWDEIARPVSRGGPIHQELEERRWGPGGRQAFGDPRPGDRYPSRSLPLEEAS